MKGLNHCTFIGHLGGDPEVRYTASGKAVANASLAVTEKWTAQGEKKESTTWIRLTMWDKLAEIAGQYLKKGKPLYVQGAIKIEEYEGRDGAGTRQSISLTVTQMIMLDSNPNPGGNGQSVLPSRSTSQGGQRQPAGGGGGNFNEEDDLPF